MEKNQIFIKSGTEYKNITKELLEASNLAEQIRQMEERHIRKSWQVFWNI